MHLLGWVYGLPTQLGPPRFHLYPQKVPYSLHLYSQKVSLPHTAAVYIYASGGGGGGEGGVELVTGDHASMDMSLAPPWP